MTEMSALVAIVVAFLLVMRRSSQRHRLLRPAAYVDCADIHRRARRERGVH
jgi:hypothetical protein